MLKKYIPALTLTLLLLILTGFHTPAQEIMRIEHDAENLSLPFYTIPLGEIGFVVLKGSEIKNRKVSTYELFHYDILFNLVNQKNLRTDRSVSFAGWEITDSAIVFLFLEDQPGLSGAFIYYHFQSSITSIRKFSYPNIHFSDPFWVSQKEDVYLAGISTERSKKLFRRNPQGKSKELFILSPTLGTDTTRLVSFNAAKVTNLINVKPQPNGNLWLTTRVADGKYSEHIEISRYDPEKETLSMQGSLPSTMEHYLIDMRSGFPTGDSMIVAGTFGTRNKKSWIRNETVTAEGFFMGFPDSTKALEERLHFYPFSRFSNFTSSLRQRYFKSNRTKNSGPKDQQGWRMLLHNELYPDDSAMVLVAEAYYPEYEYESRPQSHYYSYYGYYPGFYDTQGRWVFQGFRYDHAVLAAFDTRGTMIWENNVETSNILDKNLTTRINLFPVEHETVLVYAHDGRIWYRVIKNASVVIDKESYPLELPSSEDKVRENYGMNMAPWYARYFLVWGRQSIRSGNGKNRTIYYCTKLAFE